MLDLEMGGRLSNFPDVLGTVLLPINQLPRFSGNFQIYKFRLTIYESVKKTPNIENSQKFKTITDSSSKDHQFITFELMSSEGSSRPVRAAFYFGTRRPCLGCAADWLCGHLLRGPAVLPGMRGALLTRRPGSTRRGGNGAPTEVPGHVAAPARPVVRFLHLAVPGSWLRIVQFAVAILHATVD